MLARLLCLTMALTACQHAPVHAEVTPSAVPETITHADLLERIPQTAEQAVQSVVSISTTRTRSVSALPPMFNDPMFRHFFGDSYGAPRQRQEQGVGSGVIVRSDGIILTNAHVVEDADELEVTLKDGRTLTAAVVGTDSPSDVAVLRLEDPPSDLVPISMGDSSSLRLGEVVLAIGNPFGIGQTVTMGIVSATGRTNIGIEDYEDFIQTDAAINPGNSGGALVNTRGELVGINTAIYSRSGGYQGIGFAIPVDMAEDIMASLLENGRVERGWLGIAIQTVDEDLAEALELDQSRGVLVSDVTPDSPADSAGLRQGDVIVTLNGKEMTDASRLRNTVALAGAGEPFSMTVIRNGREKNLQGTLGEQKSAATKVIETTEELFGLQLSPLDDTARAELSVPDRVQSGMVVQQVEPDSQAARAGLKSGDVILEVNRQPIDSVAALKRAWKGTGERVPVRVWRSGAAIYLVLPRDG